MIRDEFDPCYLGNLICNSNELTFRIHANPEVVNAFRQYIDLLHRVHAFITDYLMTNIPLGCDAPIRFLVSSEVTISNLWSRYQSL
jgi:hypothetical protein